MAGAGRAHYPRWAISRFLPVDGRTRRRPHRGFAQRRRWVPHRTPREHARRAASIRLQRNDRHERARVSSAVFVLGGMSAALLCAGVAGLVVKPTPRLAGRVRPYTIVARADLGRSADVLGVAQQNAPAHGGVVSLLFWPPLRALAGRVGRLVETRSDEHLRLK